MDYTPDSGTFFWRNSGKLAISQLRFSRTYHGNGNSCLARVLRDSAMRTQCQALHGGALAPRPPSNTAVLLGQLCAWKALATGLLELDWRAGGGREARSFLFAPPGILSLWASRPRHLHPGRGSRLPREGAESSLKSVRPSQNRLLQDSPAPGEVSLSLWLRGPPLNDWVVRVSFWAFPCDAGALQWLLCGPSRCPFHPFGYLSNSPLI